MDFKRRPTARQFTSNFEMTRSYRVVAGDTRESLLLINPQYTNLTAEVSVSSGGSSATYDEEFTGFGGELGYRFYTGDRGMNGLFAGIFALGGAYQAKNPFAGLLDAMS